MGIDKLIGWMGPADAMSSDDPAFKMAYLIASKAILDTLMQFEKTTGRIVESVVLERLETSSVSAPFPQSVRQVAIHYLPKPGDRYW